MGSAGMMVNGARKMVMVRLLLLHALAARKAAE